MDSKISPIQVSPKGELIFTHASDYNPKFARIDSLSNDALYDPDGIAWSIGRWQDDPYAIRKKC